MTNTDSILIPIRYGDLDPQGHVNNSRLLTFIEQARLEYLYRLGLWDGQDFMAFGLIVADAHVAYRTQIHLWQTVRVYAWVSRMGGKSLRTEYRLEDAETGELFATAETVMVAYDYRLRQSIPISDEWRARIAAHEGIPLRGEAEIGKE
ncbi:MAG TPA: thioesterase family protein [Anaerolineaceae bacterium]